MDSHQEAEQRQQAIQSFKEFTGSNNEASARRLLLMCEWDVQRAINIFFMRGAPTDDEVVGENEEMQQQQEDEQRFGNVERGGQGGEFQTLLASPSAVPRRISHFARRKGTRQAASGDDEIDIVPLSSNSSIATAVDDSSERIFDRKDDGGSPEIRAPIPAVQGVMLAQSFQETYENGSTRHTVFNQFRDVVPLSAADSLKSTVSSASISSELTLRRAKQQPPVNSFKQRQAAHRQAMDRYHQQRRKQSTASNGNMEEESGDGEHNGENSGGVDAAAAAAENAVEETVATTGGFAQGGRRSRDLRVLFRPPVEMIFYGDWDQALQAARQKNVWLLVNVQNAYEFACAVLNRDIWSAETVKEVIRPNFLFWQVYHDSADGARVRGYYGFDIYPALFIVDPRTGEEVQKLMATDVATFLEHLTTFLSRYPTFEARDLEFRQMAAQGRLLPTVRQEDLTTTTHQSSTQQALLSPVLTSPPPNTFQSSHFGKKRKLPGVNGSREDEMARGRHMNSTDYGAAMEEDNIEWDRDDDEEENAREANRQAKKMKRVVTISENDQFEQASAAAAASSSMDCNIDWGAAAPVAFAAAQKGRTTITKAGKQEKNSFNARQWEKWAARDSDAISAGPSHASTSSARPVVNLRLRLPNGERHSARLWANAPLYAIFSLVAHFGLDPCAHCLVLDHPRREFFCLTDDENNGGGDGTETLLESSLLELCFANQELVNVEKRQAK